MAIVKKKKHNGKMHVRRGDQVVVIAGKDRGKKGKVLRVHPGENRVVVEGVNMAKKHTRPNQRVMQGGIVDQENPIHASNVMVICRSCGQATRVGSLTLEDGSRVRRCVKCGEVLDK